MQSWEVTYLGLRFPFCKMRDRWGYLVSSQISRSQWLPSHPRPRSMSCAGSPVLNGTEEQSPQLKGIEMEVSTFHLELYAADCAMANPAVNAARGCAAVRVPPNRGKGCSLRLSLSHRQSWQEKPTHSSQCSGYWCTLGLTWPGFETHL